MAKARAGYCGPRRSGIEIVSPFCNERRKRRDGIVCPNCGSISELGEPYTSIDSEGTRSLKRIAICSRVDKGDRCPRITVPAETHSIPISERSFDSAIVPSFSIKRRIREVMKHGYNYGTFSTRAGLPRTTLGHYMLKGCVKEKHERILRTLEEIEREIGETTCQNSQQYSAD